MKDTVEHYVAARQRLGCFSDLPGLVRYLLLGEAPPARARTWLGGLDGQYETVIFLFVDALGLRFLEQYPEATAVLRRIEAEGRLHEIASQFPSTTAAHVTCMHTGLSVGESGLYEWHMYDPQIDAMISPLLFSYSGDDRRETLRSCGASPELLFPERTFYQDLSARGVSSYVFQSRSYTESTYSQAVTKGATLVPYRTLPEALTLLEHVVRAGQGPRYCFLYWDAIDTIGHVHGPNSPQIEAEIAAFLTLLDLLFLRGTRPSFRNAIVLATADHGLAETYPERTIYLNQAPELKGLVDMLRRNQRGDLLVPAGSCRDLFLHVHTDALQACQALLQEFLGSRALVLPTARLAELGIFGPTDRIAPIFWRRVGNLVVLPAAGEAVWWYVRGKFEQHFLGHHGGISPLETRVPLALF